MSYAVVVLLVFAAILLITRRRRRDVVVLGVPYANAQVRQEQHEREHGRPAQPLIRDVYDYEKQELDLLDPQPSSVDDEVRGLALRFRAASASERESITRSLSMDDFYTLLEFARRTVVFALRTKDASHVVDAMTSLAMIDETRIDVRDLHMAIALQHHAATRIGSDPAALFENAAQLAAPAVAEMMKAFPKLPAQQKDIRSSWGYDEVDIDGAIGLIQRSFDDYSPRIDMARVAVQIGNIVRADYVVSSTMIATELPPVWFGPNEARAEPLVARSRATASVHGEKRGDHAQNLFVFVSEFDDEREPSDLLALSGRGPVVDDAIVAIAVSKLFGLVVARSTDRSIATRETKASLGRFKAAIEKVLSDVQE